MGRIESTDEYVLRLFERRKHALRATIEALRSVLDTAERELNKEGEPFLTGSRANFSDYLTTAAEVETLGRIVAERHT